MVYDRRENETWVRCGMNRIARFMKVSAEQFKTDWKGTFPDQDTSYEALKLPRRATAGSAGYDFYSPLDFVLEPGQSIKIPTGMRVQIEKGWVLLLFPRSGLGFKYRLQLDNTVGVIDADYFGADNEGHIFIKLTNLSNEGKTLCVCAGEAFAQGIFLPFGITHDDAERGVRTGGFGSTNFQNEEN